MRTASCLFFATLLSVTTACGDSDPVDAAGDYTISVTNRENGCGFDNWTEGDSASNIGLTITQDGSDVTGTVTGATGTWLNLVLGDNVFRGSASGGGVTMTLFGTRSTSQGNCTYTVNATIGADADGDVLTGDILYEAATNGNPDCASLDGCASRQEFNGTRPPQ